MYSPCVKHFWCAIYIKKRSLYVNFFYFLNVFDVQINIYTHMRVLQAFQSEIAFYKCHTLPGIYWSVGTRSGKFLSFDAPIGARGFDGRGLCYSYCPESLLIDAHRWLLLEKFFFFSSPFVFQCSALISYQSHTSHSTYTVKPLRNIRENNNAPKFNKVTKLSTPSVWVIYI